MTRPVSQTVYLDTEIDMRATGHSEPEGDYVDAAHMNEFTIGGKSWDEAKLRAWFEKRSSSYVWLKADAVWDFITALGDDNADADSWESV